MGLKCRLKKLVKSLWLIIILFFSIGIIFYLYGIYNEYYGYIGDFKKAALDQGYSDIVNQGEYYRVYQDRLHYLVLVKGNSNKYIVKKSEGLSLVDLTKYGVMESSSVSNVSLEPSTLLVGNTRVKSLNGYLYWRFANEEGEAIYVDYFRH